jgi:anti-anti-sigma factor
LSAAFGDRSHEFARATAQRVYGQYGYATEPRTPASSPDRGQAQVLGTCNAIGEIDAATAPQLRRNLRAGIDAADTVLVVIDFSLVTFIDSTAYDALVDATKYAAARDHVLVIRNVQPFHATVLRLCDQANDLNLDPESALFAAVVQLESIAQ